MAGKAASEKQIWWVLQAQSGSREALDELFKSVQEPLFRYIVAVVKDRHLAEDVFKRCLSGSTGSSGGCANRRRFERGAHFNRGIARVLKALELLK